MRPGSAKKGMTLVEVLTAALILVVGLMGLVSAWAFSYQVTINVDNTGVGYNIGRQTVEQVKYQGFDSAPEGTTTTYYDANMNRVGSSAQSRFTVVTQITSDILSGGVPAPGSLRLVSVTVTLTGTGAVLYTTTTYLVRAGI